MAADERLQRYISGWGRPGDVGMVAEDGSGQQIGAAWFRLYSPEQSGYGFIDPSTPEVSIAVEQEWRGHGVGTALLNALLQAAAAAGFQALSLSVSPDNPALHLYERLGFVKIKLVGGSWTMRRPVERLDR